MFHQLFPTIQKMLRINLIRSWCFVCREGLYDFCDFLFSEGDFILWWVSKELGVFLMDSIFKGFIVL